MNAHDKIWRLASRRGREVADLEVELDVLDAQIEDERHLQYLATRARLERLGFDVSKYRPPPKRSRAEQRCSRHVQSDDDVAQLIAEAQRTELEKLHAQHIARKEPVSEPAPLLRRYGCGKVLGVR